MDETETKVIEIVSEQMGVDKSEITRETHFINDLNADSLDTVELVMTSCLRSTWMTAMIRAARSYAFAGGAHAVRKKSDVFFCLINKIHC